MPIFEYKCKKCGEVFELLVRESTKPACPKCGGKRLEKLVSGFSVSATGKGGGRRSIRSRQICGNCPSGGGDCCSGGSCCCGCH